MTTSLAPACLGTADDVHSPLHARIAASGVQVARVPLPMPACWIAALDLLALDSRRPYNDPELARCAGRLLDARPRLLAERR